MQRRLPVPWSFPWVCWVQLEDTIAKDLEACPVVAGDDNGETGIGCGGQKLQEPAARKFQQKYPWITIQQVFGMAEGLLCYTHLDDATEIAFTTQGRPLSSADEIKIVDIAGEPVSEGEIGELWCRGPYTIRGYYRAADRNLEAFSADGFYKTGDLVRRGAGIREAKG